MAIDHNKLCEKFGCRRHLFDCKGPQNTKTISFQEFKQRSLCLHNHIALNSSRGLLLPENNVNRWRRGKGYQECCHTCFPNLRKVCVTSPDNLHDRSTYLGNLGTRSYNCA